MNLGVLVTRPPRLLEAPALDGEEDDDDGGEEADDDGGHPDGNEVLLLEPVLHHVLRWLRRDRHHHVQGEVGHGPPRPVLRHALEGPVIVQVGSQQDQLALDGAGGEVGVPVVVLAHVDVADHGGAVVDEEAAVPPGDLGSRPGGDGADKTHILPLDYLLISSGRGDLGGASQLSP